MSDYTPNSGTFPLEPTGASGLANTGQTEQNYDYFAEFFGDIDGHTNYSNSGQESFATPAAAAIASFDKQGSSAQYANANFGNSEYQNLMQLPVTGTAPRIQNIGSHLVQERSSATTTKSGGSASVLVQSEAAGRQTVPRTASRVDPQPLNLGDVRKIRQIMFWGIASNGEWFPVKKNGLNISEGAFFDDFINAPGVKPKNITFGVTYDDAENRAIQIGPQGNSKYVFVADFFEMPAKININEKVWINMPSPISVTFGDLGWRLGWFNSPSPVIWNRKDHWSIIWHERDGVTKEWTKIIHPNGDPVTMATFRKLTVQPEWLRQVCVYFWHRHVDFGWISKQNGDRLSLFDMRNSNDDVFVTSDSVVPYARVLTRKLVDRSGSAIKFEEFVKDSSILYVQVVDETPPPVPDCELAKNGQPMHPILFVDKNGKVKNVYPNGKESTMADSVAGYFYGRGKNTGCVQNYRAAKAKSNAAGDQGGQSTKSAKKRKVGNVGAMGDDEPGTSYGNEWDAVDMAFMS